MRPSSRAKSRRADGAFLPRGDRRVARRGRRLRPQWMREPLPQQPAARRGGAGVEQRQQRRRRLAAQRGGDLEIAPRRGVELQVFARAFHAERAHVRERRGLRAGGVVEQRAGGAHGEVEILDAEGREVARAELSRQRTGCGRGVEAPGRQRARRHGRTPRHGNAGGVRDQQLGDVEAFQRRGGLGGGHLGQRELSRRQIEPGDAGAMPSWIRGDQQAVALGVEQVGVGHRAGRDHAQHLALDRSLARRRIADLLADRDRLAELHQLGEIAVDRMERHARHRDRRAGRLSARGERDVEQARRALRVVVEQLVEVAHPVEQKLVRMLRLGAQILPHHGRMGGEFCLG